MFPDFGDEAIDKALDKTGNNLEATIDALISRPISLEERLDNDDSVVEVLPPRRIKRNEIRSRKRAEVSRPNGIFTRSPELAIERSGSKVKRVKEPMPKTSVEVTEIEKPRDKVSQERPKVITMDLHGMSYIDAKKIVSEYLRNARAENVGVINFITGIGHNSPVGIPVLKPMVIKLCERSNIRATVPTLNPGVVVCEINEPIRHVY